MICGQMTALQISPDKVKAVRIRCKSWECPHCAPKRRKRLMHEAAKGKPNRFITLTVNPADFDHPDQAARALSLAWRRCREQLKRYHGHKILESLCIFERTKKGWPHLHILCRSGFIPQKWIAKYMGERINSPVVDIRKIKNVRGAILYVAKYVVKAPERFRGCKRYWRTANYIGPRPKKEPPSHPWQIVFTSLENILFTWGEAASPNFTHPDDVVIRGQSPPA